MKQWALKKLGHYVSEEVKHIRNVSFKIYLRWQFDPRKLIGGGSGIIGSLLFIIPFIFF